MIRTYLIVPGLLLAALPAQTFAETGDAGDLPATAQVPVGVGALTQIDGNINDPSIAEGAGNDHDMYLIHIANPAAFTATTVGGTSLDTQLFLFHANGLGVAFNDDTAVTTQSALSGVFVPAAGDYYLAVARFDRDATGLGAEIWADTPFTAERAPDGPGAANAVDGWNGTVATALIGSYSIFLTGASFVAVVTCCDLAVSGSGAPGTNVTLTLTGADPHELAMGVIGTTVGLCEITWGILGTVELGLLAPWHPLPLGRTDDTGSASRTIHVPRGLRLPSDLFAQAFTSVLTHTPGNHPPPALTFCTSDVELVHIGK